MEFSYDSDPKTSRTRFGRSSMPKRPDVTVDSGVPWSQKNPTRRRTVAMPDETEFVTSIRKPRNIAPAIPVWSSIKNRIILGRKGKSKIGLRDYILKAGWIFCFFILLRLLFADRGVMEYYSRMELLQKNNMGLKQLLQENIALSENIIAIQYDKTYQKKLVRDHLGFISKDEFLILFPKKKKVKSI